MSELGDSLLYVLSAWSDTTWRRYREAFDDLARRDGTAADLRETVEFRFQRDATRRILQALGHIDFGAGARGDRMKVTPPRFVALPTAGLPRAVLAGARAPATAAMIRSKLRKRSPLVLLEVSSQKPSWGFAPRRIALEGETINDIEEFAREIGVGFTPRPAAWVCLERATPISEYLATRDWEEQRELTWLREDFSPYAVAFTRERVVDDGLRLSRYQDPVRGNYVYLLWQGGRRAIVDVDPARWAVLSAAGIVALDYDRAGLEIQSPVTVPIPGELSRAAVLCSGFAPLLGRTRLPDRRVTTISYRSVPPDVYLSLAAKLGQLRSPRRGNAEDGQGDRAT